MTLQTLWKDYLDALLAEMPALAALIATQVRERTLALLGNASHCAQRPHLLAVAHALRAESTTFTDALAAALRQQVQEAVQEATAPAPPRRPDACQRSQLSLADDEQLERDIELARLIQTIESSAEWELRELQAVCASLKRARSIRAEHNPLRPEMCARALLSSLEQVGLDHPARVLALHVSASVLAVALRELYAQHCRSLRRLDIPALRFRVCIDSRVVASRADGDGAWRGLVARMAGHVERRGSTTTSPGQPELQPHDQMWPAQLIPRLLEQIADEAEMSSAMRALVARLRAPVVRAAAVEPGVLRSLAHPVWRLVDRIASLCSVNDADGDDGPATLAMLLEPIVARLEQADRPGSELFEEALQRIADITTRLNSAQLSSLDQLDIDLTKLPPTAIGPALAEPAARRGTDGDPDALPAHQGDTQEMLLPDAPRTALPPTVGTDHPLPTIPMDMVDTEAETPAKQNHEAWLAELAPGDLCRLFIQGRWMNAQMTWRSSNGQFCVFSSRHGGRLHSLTRRQLARLRAEGLAATIERGQQVRDAVETLTRDLSANGA